MPDSTGEQIRAKYVFRVIRNTEVVSIEIWRSIPNINVRPAKPEGIVLSYRTKDDDGDGLVSIGHFSADTSPFMVIEKAETLRGLWIAIHEAVDLSQVDPDIFKAPIKPDELKLGLLQLNAFRLVEDAWEYILVPVTLHSFLDV